MGVKKVRKRRIKVTPRMRKDLAAEFGLTVQSIGNALRGNTEGPTPERVRLRALEIGGIETIDTILIEY